LPKSPYGGALNLLMVIDARRVASEICASNGWPKLDTEDVEKYFVPLTAIYGEAVA
jgi:hypothetical protein